MSIQLILRNESVAQKVFDIYLSVFVCYIVTQSAKQTNLGITRGVRINNVVGHLGYKKLSFGPSRYLFAVGGLDDWTHCF